jgi:hypothetical protein
MGHVRSARRWLSRQIDLLLLKRPFDRRVLQSPFEDLASQSIGILANGRVRRELRLACPVCLDLLANVFVIMSEPFVRHIFDTHVNSRSNEAFPLRLNRLLLARRTQLAGEPAHGVSLQRIDGKGNLLDAVTGAALERPFLKAPLAGRNSSQSHPVFARGTHWPLTYEKWIAHNPTPAETIGASLQVGLSGVRHTDKISSSIPRLGTAPPGASGPLELDKYSAGDSR